MNDSLRRVNPRSQYEPSDILDSLMDLSVADIFLSGSRTSR